MYLVRVLFILLCKLLKNGLGNPTIKTSIWCGLTCILTCINHMCFQCNTIPYVFQYMHVSYGHSPPIPTEGEYWNLSVCPSFRRDSSERAYRNLVVFLHEHQVLYDMIHVFSKFPYLKTDFVLVLENQKRLQFCLGCIIMRLFCLVSAHTLVFQIRPKLADRQPFYCSENRILPSYSKTRKYMQKFCLKYIIVLLFGIVSPTGTSTFEIGQQSIYSLENLFCLVT